MTHPLKLISCWYYKISDIKTSLTLILFGWYKGLSSILLCNTYSFIVGYFHIVPHNSNNINIQVKGHKASFFFFYETAPLSWRCLLRMQPKFLSFWIGRWNLLLLYVKVRRKLSNISEISDFTIFLSCIFFKVKKVLKKGYVREGIFLTLWTFLNVL